MKARKIYEMPVEGMFLHPEFIKLPAAGVGSLVRLVMHYWMTDCAPIPIAHSELFAVCRPSPRVWNTHKTIILKIFKDIEPSLRDYFERRAGLRDNLIRLANYGHAKQRSEAAVKKQQRHGDRLDAAPKKDADEYQRVATPEERGARRGVAPTRKG